MDIECSVCNIEVRKDTLLTHITKNHPTFLWDHIFCTYQHINPDDYTLRTSRNMRIAINILEDERVPYELADGVHIDFGSKCSYTGDKTAIKHILDHPVKHRDGFFQMIKDSITPEKMVALLKWIVGKRPTIVQDARIISELKEEIAKRDETYRNNVAMYCNEMRRMEERIKSFREGEEQQQIEELKEKLREANAESRKLTGLYNDLLNETKQYRRSDKEWEASNQKNLQQEQQEWDAYMKLKEDIQKKATKDRETYEKETKKNKETYEKEIEKLTQAFEKKESKYKKEIKTLKHLNKILKVKAEKPESDSDSDSD
jgi:hypothetical protein